MSKNWHIRRDADSVTISRHATPRFDVAARAAFPPLRAVPLAHMIRQDMWRLLRDLRGFAPVVRVEKTAQGLDITAGGAVAGRFPKRQTEARIGAFLQDSDLRARWQRCALLTCGKVVL